MTWTEQFFSVAVPQKIFKNGSGVIVSTRTHAAPILFTRSRVGKPISVKEAMDLQNAMTIDAPGSVVEPKNDYKFFRLYVVVRFLFSMAPTSNSHGLFLHSGRVIRGYIYTILLDMVLRERSS